MAHGRIYVAGTCDTKGDELRYVKGLIEAAGVPAVLVDLGTKGEGGPADVAATEVAAHHPEGPGAVFSGDRGRAVSAMAVAFERFIRSRDDVAGLIGLGGSGGTALGDRRHARPAGRHAQAHGLDRRLGQRRPLRRPERHRDDVLGHRHRRPQPHLAHHPRQRRPRHRRHGQPASRRRPPTPSPPSASPCSASPHPA